MIRLENLKLVTAGGIKENCSVLIDGDKIARCGTEKISEPAEVIDLKGNYLSAGFIDLHVHGGGGSSFMDESREDFISVIKYHESQGTLNLMPTALTAPRSELNAFLDIYTDIKENSGVSDNLLGAHMEGPYLNSAKCGAQNGDLCALPSINGISLFLDRCPYIRRFTLAPELDEGFRAARFLKERGILVSAGHTDALYDVMKEALCSGYEMITHMYAAMNGLEKVNGFRRAGAVEAILLNDDVYVELIADGKHLPAPVIELVYRIKGKDRVILVSDAMRATGTDCRESFLGKKEEKNRVIIEDGVAKMKNKGCLAGSITPLNKMAAFVYKNTGIALFDIISMITETPAKICGAWNRLGSVSEGKYADLVVFDEDINVLLTIKRGRVKVTGVEPRPLTS
ncbi:MAG: N-acetylglucosamine-6-phosphate deacetylase [Lachnospiraceae bacterium]|nr:N-acetylglucosamine-6-phosphate deacetylase [Lachnospiraceae bacterium]